MSRTFWAGLGLLVLIVAWMGVFLPSPEQELNVIPVDSKIRIGVVSATWEDHSQYEFLAKLAERDINDYCKESGVQMEFEFILACAEGTSKTAYERVGGFREMGITLVTGLPWTTMLCSSRGWGEEHDMVLMSTVSSGSHLRIKDNSFRLNPYNGFIAKPLVAALTDSGVSDVLVIRRGDSWSEDIMGEFKPLFESKGGTVTTLEYDGSEMGPLKFKTREADEALKEIIEKGDADSTGVVYLGFTEALYFLKYGLNTSLVSVPWFGTDATINKTIIMEEAGEGAAMVSLVSPVPVAVNSTKYRRVNELYMDSFGTPMSLEEANLYDSCWLLAKTVIETNSTDQDKVTEKLPDIASRHFGASGPCNLDEYGDRVSSQYDYWEYDMVNGTVQAIKTGSYDWTGNIEWFD